MDKQPSRQIGQGAAGRRATGTGRQGASSPFSGQRRADTARPGAQIYLPMLLQPAIGFVITDSNVHGINILTN